MVGYIYGGPGLYIYMCLCLQNCDFQAQILLST